MEQEGCGVSKRTTTIYRCDLCGVELDSRDVLTLHLPVLAHLINEYGTENTTVLEVQEHDLCSACADKLTVVEMDRGLVGPILDEDKLRLRGDAE